MNPVGFLEFLRLESNARLVLTDSGGVQEETCILGVPCVTLRDNTERPEILGVKSNVLAGADALRMVENAKRMMQQGMGGRIRLEAAEREGLSLSISEIDHV
jgi:UDP-N-acetylglucosamine 2-epimerase (non-hydrolysing)